MNAQEKPTVDPLRDALYRDAHAQFLAHQRQPGIALMLSLVATGAGQFYNGERLRGLVLAALYLVGAVATVQYGWPLFLWIPFWIWGMEDARRGARRGNRALLDRLAADVATHQPHA